MNDLLVQKNIFDTAESLERYGYSGRIFTSKFLKQFFFVLLSNLSALILLTADSFVVSHFVGKDALNSVQLLSPFVAVISSFSSALPFGTNYVLSKTFGIGSEEAVQKTFRAIVRLTVCFLIGVSVVQIPVLYCMIDVYAVNPEIKQMMSLYAIGMMVSASVSIVNVVCTYILIASGRSKTLLKLTILESTLNIVLDLLFVPICKMGVLGAGLGSAISCTVRGVVSVILVQRIFKVFPLKRVGCKNEMRKIMSNGLPNMFSSIALSLMGFVMSAVVVKAGGMEAVTVISVCEFAGSFMSLVANSFVQTGSPLIGMLVASEEWEIAKNLHKKILAMCVLTVSAIVLFIFLLPKTMFAVYGIPDYSDFQLTSVRLYVLKYVAFACSVCFTNLCIFCGKRKITILTGVLKSALLAPVFLALGYADRNLVFLSYFICESIPVCILFFVLFRTLRSRTEESKAFDRVHFSFRGSEAADVSEKLGKYLLEHDTPAKIAYRLALTCEEIGAYAVGGKIGEDPQIFLSIRKSEDGIFVFYLDDGTPALLNKKLTQTDLVTGNYDLLKSMAEEFSYRNTGGMNRFIIRFKL